MKLLCTGLALLAVISCFGQSRRSGEVTSEYINKDVRHGRQAMEEVYYPTFGDECTLELITVGAGDTWGRISGMNGFGDLEKAQRLEFNASDNFQVVGALMFFERPAIVGNGVVNVKVYTVDDDTKGPGVLRGFSDGLRMSEVAVPDSVAVPTIFTFENGVEVNLDHPQFFVSCNFDNLYDSRDTLVLLQTVEGCGDGSNTWELFADGTTWTSIIADGTWEMNADFVIGAIVDFETTSTEPFITSGNLQVHPPFPNPAVEEVFLNYTLLEPGMTSIDLYDISGQLLKRTEKQWNDAGRHQYRMDIQELSSGSYVYRIVTEEGSLTSRFIVK